MNKFKPISLKRLFELKSKKIGWLAEQLIPRGITIISASPSNHKTWLLLEIIKSLSLGDKLFGHFDCSKNRILLIDEENTIGLLQKRLTMLRIDKNAEVYFLVRKGFKLDKEDDLNMLKNYIEEHDIDVVCFDSFVRINSKIENDARQIADFFSSVNEIIIMKVSIIMTHHNRKNYNNYNEDMRGSSDILAAVDCNLTIKTDKTKGIITVGQKKLRQDKELPNFELRIIEEDKEIVGFEYIGTKEIKDIRNELKNKITRVLESGLLSQVQIVDKLADDAGRNKILEILAELTDENKIKVIKKEKNKKYYKLLSP